MDEGRGARLANIGSDREKPAWPERYQLLLRSTKEVQIWLPSGVTDGCTNERQVGLTERRSYRATVHDCRTV
jgi:hypothetical protein